MGLLGSPKISTSERKPNPSPPKKRNVEGEMGIMVAAVIDGKGSQLR